MKAIVFLIISSCLLLGCAYPNAAKVEQKDNRPAIGISGAPKGTLLFVDGLRMGETSRYNGKAGVLMVESGKHLIEVKTEAGKILLSQDLFLSNSTTKIIPFRR